MMSTTLAVDPGKGGAFAWVTSDGMLIDAVDMPIIEVRGKKRISASGIAEILSRRPIRCLVIEGVGSRPGESHVASFSFGYGAGLIEGVATGLGISLQIIPSATWKPKAGVPADKGAAREMASRLWPGAADKFKRVRDDGRADASLLARWAGARAVGSV